MNETPKRGDAAWKAEKERVANRNAQARKAGRAQREAYEQQGVAARRDREARQMADLLGKQDAG